MFLRNSEALDPFKTFSNQTPARPESRQAPLTASKPKNCDPEEEFVLWLELEGNCTIAIPIWLF